MMYKEVILVNAIILIILSFFALYGIFTAAYDILFKGIRPKKDAANTFRTLIADNCENAEEYIRYFSAKNDRNEKFIILCSSQEAGNEKTARILEAEFDFVSVMNAEEYFRFIDEVLNN